jgi:DAK2 domain fusion protein YloV
MAVTQLDGRDFGRFVAAGTYFLRKYRGVLNDLNVFPVPDGDTGSNMYLTAKAALRGAAGVRGQALHTVADAAAKGSLLGARGNSGVILSQMLRGFSHSVRHRDTIDTFQLALAMREASAAARAALTKPVEGTILSVASAAADEAYRLAVREPDFTRLASAIVRSANAALERTPEQLPALKEAGVVDSGGAGLCYFLEGALHFLPEHTSRVTSFPQRPVRSAVFTRQQTVGEYRFCTEFVLDDATLDALPLRELLERHGDSLLVIGAAPTLKVHLHSADPDAIRTLAARHGTVTRWKAEDMAHQHHLLVVDAPARPIGIACVVPGPGFERIARELGADVTIAGRGDGNSSVEELLVGVNSSLAPLVYLLPNDPNVALAAREVAALSEKDVIVLPTRDPVAGMNAVLRLAGRTSPLSDDALAALADEARGASVFFAGKAARVDGSVVERNAPLASIGSDLRSGPTLGAVVLEAAAMLGAADGGLVTLYYGGAQKERDAQKYAALVGERFGGVQVEYYFGGQPNIEYWIGVER